MNEKNKYKQGWEERFEEDWDFISKPREKSGYQGFDSKYTVISLDDPLVREATKHLVRKELTLALSSYKRALLEKRYPTGLKIKKNEIEDWDENEYDENIHEAVSVDDIESVSEEFGV